MRIPGVADTDLVQMHWNYGGGRGAIAHRHVPSGITVRRECPPDVSVHQLDSELLVELTDKLRAAGILGGEEELNE
jgi:hypothetical protein